MTDKILLLYASVDGQTKKISNVLTDQLKQEGKQMSLYEVADFDGI